MSDRAITEPLEMATRRLPANFGPLRDATANARLTGPCGDTMEFWLWCQEDRIVQATFTTDGCAASIASGSMAAHLADGKTIAEAARLTPEEVLSAIGGLPEDHRHCPVLAVNALKTALARVPRGRAAAPTHASSGGQQQPAATETAAPVAAPAPADSAQRSQQEALTRRQSRIACKLVVLSGKGGVGKSTVAVNLAVALAAAGKRVGLLDVDVHGPSVPKLLGIEGRRPETRDGEIEPIRVSERLTAMSVGCLLGGKEDAVIWRGPMKYNVIRQLLSDVAWGDLDVLVVDSPPGTGDEPLAVAQLVGRPAAAVVVTTPQELSLADVRRSITFCRQVGLPVAGLIENMSGHVCPHCQQTTALFKAGGGARLAQEMTAPFLGALPIDPLVVEADDNGTPFIDRYPESPSARAFAQMAQAISLFLSPQEKITMNQETVPVPSLLKIAVPLSGGRLAEHFGHCDQFALVDADPQSQQAAKIALVTPPPHEPGLLPRWLQEQGVQVVIAGGIGQRALTLFGQHGIVVRAGFSAAPVDELVHAFLKGELKGSPQGCAQHHDGHPHHQCGH